MNRHRYLENQVKKDLKSKMVFLGGPRQVGKTTLAQSLFGKKGYLNWDIGEDRHKILSSILPNHNVWIFDEIHKYKKWRNYLKGLYDKHKDSQQILVTGSTRLDLYKYSGDSLQGRYHFLRLHPLNLDEVANNSKTDFANLMELGGFPEPFLKSDAIEAKRWSREYRQRILTDDINPVERIEDLGQAELLLLRLPELVGSPLSINSLTEDLQVSFKTIKRWISIFERFYAIFRLPPFGHSLIKAVKKEQKHYHFDWTLIKNPGLRFENLIACQLLKWAHYLQDTQGREVELKYFRDKEQREVDFVLTEENLPIIFIECKSDSHQVGPHLKYLKLRFPEVPTFQLTMNSEKDFVTPEKIRVCDAYKSVSELKNILGINLR